jgi:phospholipase C
VPAVIISPYVRPGSVIRPPGATPFDHTSIIATLRKLFTFAPLTARDAAAPDLLGTLDARPDNDGPAAIAAPAIPPTPAEVAVGASKPLNSLQKSLISAAVHLPTAGANIGAHIARLSSVKSLAPFHASVADAAADVAAHVKAFLGRP